MARWAHVVFFTESLLRAGPDRCAKLIQNMSHQRWRHWVSPDIDYIKVCPNLPVAPD